MTDHEDKLILASANRLRGKLVRSFVRGGFNRQTVQECEEIIADHKRRAWDKEGIRFPDLVMLILDQQRYIHLVCADLDPAGINTVAVNLAMMFPKATPDEIARAIVRAFPDHKPSAQLNRNVDNVARP